MDSVEEKMTTVKQCSTCGIAAPAKGQRYCPDCRVKYMRAWRRKKAERYFALNEIARKVASGQCDSELKQQAQELFDV